MNLFDQLRVRQANKAAETSPDGKAYECGHCGSIFGVPQAHVAVSNIPCPAGSGRFHEFVRPEEKDEPPLGSSVPVFIPGPKPPKVRRAAPSTIRAESVECPTCKAQPGKRCRTYRGDGCAPHATRVEAAKTP